MIDMEKEITFAHNVTLDGNPITDFIGACAFVTIRSGYEFGLKLDEFIVDDIEIVFVWRGTKQEVYDWFTHYSTYQCRESEEVRNKTLEIILNK